MSKKNISSGRRSNLKLDRFRSCLEKQAIDTNELRSLLWSGAPDEDPSIRAQSWQLLLGYLPPNKDRQEAGLGRKRQEYHDLVQEYFDGPSVIDGKIIRQIRIDIPRTNGGMAWFSHERIHKLMERALCVWAVRHPASGYVQGINDLITLFITVFLAPYCDCDLNDVDLSKSVSDSEMKNVEADSYWCLSKVLAGIQDNYTCDQPGIQRMVAHLRDILKRIDENLFDHLHQQGVSFLAVTFRWMNCLLVREIPVSCAIRLWDTYIAEPGGFATFHIYVCAVFLVYWSPQLQLMDFSQLMLFVQKFPTSKWTNLEIETLLAEA
eukprot:GHVL01007952.1.p1 GENE.GHVL01007952.1~~GHVL01007952.1.p1  ORF type:complete len:343 (+),score=50.08 GHVL01007952.1:64-1029(+)